MVKYIKLFKRIFVFISLIAVVSIVGIFYQDRATASDANNYPAPGKIIEIGNLKYHLNCMGTGIPVVILEAGLGESSLSWFPIQSEIAETTQVCAYDRAGLGWSEGTNKKFSIKQVATELRQVLKRNKNNPPYILVGHSRGGIYIRSFYSQFSDMVVGMVLVDSTHEQAAALEYPYGKMGYLKQKIQTLIALPLSQTGVIRIMGWANADRHPSPLPQKVLEAKSAVQNRTSTARAIVNEIEVMREGLDLETPPPSSLGELPLIVLSSGEIYGKEAKKRGKITQIEMDLQNKLVALSSNSQHLIAKKSGHFIMYDEPGLVIDAIEEMVTSTRKNL